MMSPVTRKAAGPQKPLGMVVLRTQYRQEDGQWLGECVDLGTATFADSFEEIQRELNEAILLHLQTLEETGARAAFFKEHGIKMYRAESVPTTVKTEMQVRGEPTWKPVFQRVDVFPVLAAA